MRLLIACPQCNRQYDATGRPVGDRFRCHCGVVVEVQQPDGHDAAVVRCSSCGAPRESGAAACRFCGSDFTLHERDLHTVCPKCFARVSDRARYCHHCSTPLRPEHVAGDRTSLHCPACDGEQELISRGVGGVPVMECGRCAGLWLGQATFAELTRKASERSEGLDAFFTGSNRSQPVERAEAFGDWRYRKCPECEKMMNRRQYGSGSGVIIDSCRHHGVWFDADELPRILAFIRSGQHAESLRREAEERERHEHHREITCPRPTRVGRYDFDTETSTGGTWLAVLAEVALEVVDDWPKWWR